MRLAGPSGLGGVLSYDPKSKGWHPYGKGTVTPDGSRVVPDADTRVWTLDGSLFACFLMKPWGVGWLKDAVDWLSGDPVDLSTGATTDSQTDLAVSDAMPITLTRSYWQSDPHEREFGRGHTSSYNMFIYSDLAGEHPTLYLPGGAKVNFAKTGGAGYLGTRYAAVNTPSEWDGATLTRNTGSYPGAHWNIQRRDGMSFYFPEFGRLKAIRDANGNEVTIVRSAGSNGEIQEIRTTGGRFVKLTYSGGRVRTATDNLARKVSYTYDANGNLDTVTDVGNKVKNYDYDSSGRLVGISDARGISFLSSEYYPDGRVRHQTLAGGATYDFEYTVSADTGRVTETRVTEPNGSRRRVTFNATGAATSETVADGTSLARTTTFERGTNNRVTAAVDPFNRRTTLAYDGEGRFTEARILAGTASEASTGVIAYGDNDRPRTTTDAAGKQMSYEYDQRGNVSKLTDSDNRVTRLFYRQNGQLEKVVDPALKETRISYAGGDPASVVDATGRESTVFVDAAGRVNRSRDAEGNETTQVYDAYNQVLQVADGTGAGNAFEYDENGNLKALVDARNKRTEWDYDDADRVRQVTDPSGAVTGFGYDTAGRPTSSTAPSGRRTEWEWDALDRPTTATHQRPDGSTESVTTYAYDDVGRLRQVSDTVAGTTTYAYDERDRVREVVQPQGTVSYEYDGLDRRTSMTVAGAAPVTYSYDDADRVTGITQGGQHVGIGYDAAGRADVLTLPGGWEQRLDHDDAGRLTGIEYVHGGVAKGTLTYGHDGLGRVTSVGGSMAGVTLPGSRSGLVYDEVNRLTEAGGTPLTYDADGNLTGDGTATYTWNSRGELTGVSKTGLSAGFGYGPGGERISRTVDGARTGFVADGANTVAETDGNGGVRSSLTSGGMDQWFARTSGGATDAVLTDVLGSPVALGAADGSFAARYAYDPYGNASVSGATRGSDLGFTGRQDDGTGLMYYRDRYYSPALQRFVSQDPSGMAGGTNLYEYAAGAPTVYTDPTGNNPLLVGCLVGGLIDGGLSYGTQRLSGRKVNWGWSGVGGAALQGCVMGAVGGSFLKWGLGSATSRATSLAKSEAEFYAALLRATHSGKRLPTATTAIVDRRTMKVYRGNSGHNLEVPKSLRDRLPDPSLEGWSASNCAEVAACTRALTDGARFEDLIFYTVKTKSGAYFPPCKNCSSWIPGGGR